MRKTAIAALGTLLAFSHTASAQAPGPAPSAPGTPPAAAPATPSANPDQAGPRNPEARARWEKFQAVCGADLKSHCGAVSGQGDQRRTEMRSCVDTHKAKFSAGCQSAIAERDADRAARQDAKGAKPAADKPKS